MAPEKQGSVIGAGFGLLFVLVNTTAVSVSVALPIRAIALAAFAAVLVIVCLPGHATGRATGGDHPRGGFTVGFWFVVAAEVVAVAVGRAILNGPLDAPHAIGAWISFVVGVHFVGLAILWREAVFSVLGAAMVACGLLGLVLAAADFSDAAIGLTGGALPGVLLLAFGLWSSVSQRSFRPAS